jgi:hypothetical protein
MNFPTLTLKPADRRQDKVNLPKCDTGRTAECQHYTTFADTGYKCHFEADGYCLIVGIKTLAITQRVCEASKTATHLNADLILKFVHIEP